MVICVFLELVKEYFILVYVAFTRKFNHLCSLVVVSKFRSYDFLIISGRIEVNLFVQIRLILKTEFGNDTLMGTDITNSIIFYYSYLPFT